MEKMHAVVAGLLGFAAFASVGGCSSSSPNGGAPSSNDGGGGNPGSGNYDTLKGTFVAPGINATFTGAMVGTYEGFTVWNAGGAFDLSQSAGTPTALKATGTLGSGDSAVVTINVAHIMSMPAAGTFTCASSENYDMTVAFQIFKGTSTTAVEQYTSLTTAASCDMKVESPTEVTEGTDGLTFMEYFAHGSLTATLPNYAVPGGMANGTKGTLTVSW
jgi:hypothetical protein